VALGSAPNILVLVFLSTLDDAGLSINKMLYIILDNLLPLLGVNGCHTLLDRSCR
jgi:hypothetical protein